MGIPILPRTLGVALVVGVLAFLAGTQFSPPRGTAPIVTVPTSIPSEPLAPTLAVAPAPTPTPTVLPDRSQFVSAFDPFALARKAGLPCLGGPGGGSSGGGHSNLIFTGSCSSPTADQPALVLKLEGEISTAIRDTAISRDGGFSGSNDDAHQLDIVMSWDYRSDGFDGSIYLITTTAGSNVHVVIILTEKVRA